MPPSFDDPYEHCIAALASLVACIAQTHMLIVGVQHSERAIPGLFAKYGEITTFAMRQMAELAEFGSAYDPVTDMPEDA